jgi:hypothetical protein
MLKELDVVLLTRDIQEHNLKKGSQGAIVHCYEDGQAFEVEFVSETGETWALLTLDRDNIQLERETIREQVFELIDAFPVDLLAEIRDFAEFLEYKRQNKVS